MGNNGTSPELVDLTNDLSAITEDRSKARYDLSVATVACQGILNDIH